MSPTMLKFIFVVVVAAVVSVAVDASALKLPVFGTLRVRPQHKHSRDIHHRELQAKVFLICQAGGKPGILLGFFKYIFSLKQRLRPLGNCAPSTPRKGG